LRMAPRFIIEVPTKMRWFSSRGRGGGGKGNIFGKKVEDKSPLRNGDLVKMLLRQQKKRSTSDVTVRLVLSELEIEGTATKKGMETTTLEQAMAIARNNAIDLVGVSLSQDPPVVKVMDYAKKEYDALKALKQKKKEQKEKGLGDPNAKLPLKEFKFRAGIAENDLMRKINNMKTYLVKGHRCQVMITSAFRYRREDQNAVKTTMARVVEKVTDCANEPIIKKGNQQHTAFLLTPKKATN
jgi:translation initiation factor IF-3